MREIIGKLNNSMYTYFLHLFKGPIATPDKIQITNGLPKTRSGKIMRRILRKIVEGEIDHLGDLSTCKIIIFS